MLAFYAEKNAMISFISQFFFLFKTMTEQRAFLASVIVAEKSLSLIRYFVLFFIAKVHCTYFIVGLISVERVSLITG